MNRKSQVVHLLSFLALIASLFSPVLTLPVVADDPLPEPEVVLEQGTDLETTDVQDDPAPPADEPEEPVEQPDVALIAVVPAAPILSDATCGEGVSFAQVAFAPVTEGVAYVIGPPDAAGNFTVMATLTDASVYTWAEGLDGWSIDGTTATSTGSVALCPLPEPEDEEPEQSGEAPESGEGTDEVDSADLADEDLVEDEEPSEVVTEPTTGRGPARDTGMMRSMNITAANTELEIRKSASVMTDVAVGSTIVYTITVTNNTGTDQHYSLIDTLPTGVSFESAVVPYSLDGDYCTESAGVVNCGLAEGMVLYPGWVDEWTITVTVDAITCGSPLTNTVTGSWAASNTASVSSDVRCTGSPLQIDVTDGLAPGEAAMPGTTLIYKITITNIGDTSTTITNLFSIPMPSTRGAGFETAILSGPGSICSVPYDGVTPMNCDVRVGGLLEPGATRTFTLRIDLGLLPPPEWCSEGLQLPFRVESVMGTILGETDGITTPFNCDLLTIETQGPATIDPGVPFDYIVFVRNTGIQISGTYAFEFTLPAGVVLSGPLGSACTQDLTSMIITCSGTSVPNGSTHSFGITVITDPSAAPEACTVLTATATGTVGMWSENGRSHSLDSEVMTGCSQLLIMNVTAEQAVVDPGEWATFTYTITSPTGDAPSLPFEANHDVESIDIRFVHDSIYGMNCWIHGDTSRMFDCSSDNLPPGEHDRYISVRGQVIANPTASTCESGISGTAVLDMESGVWAEHTADMLTATVQVNCQQLTMAKSVSATSVIPGDPFEYTITVANNGQNDNGAYAFTDTLPAGIELARGDAITSPDGTTCTPALSAGITTINCQSENGPPAEGDHRYTFAVKANRALDNDVCGEVTNTATGTTGRWTSGSDSVTTSVTCVPDLALSISADKTEVEPGETIEYTITVTNNGGETEDRYFFWNALPADTRLSDPDYTMPAGAHCHGNTTGSQYLDCEGYNLAPGDTHTYIYRATVSTSASPTMCQGLHTWLRGAENPDYGMWDENSIGPDGIIHTVDLLCPALSIQKSDNVEEAVPLNEPFTYTITVTNSGESAIGDFTVIDYLPAGIVLSGDLDDRCSTGVFGTQTTVTCADTSVPLGDGNANTFNLSVMAVDADGAVACSGVENMVSGDRGIWVPGKQTAFASTQVRCDSELTVTKQPLNAVVVPGGTIGYEIIVANTGDTTITSGTVSDELPELPDGGEWSYTVNGVPVDESPFDYDFTNLASGDSITFRIESNEIPADLQLPETEWCTRWVNTVVAEGVSSTAVEVDGTDAAAVQVNCTGLSIEKVVNAEVIEPGGEVEYTITVTNHGNTVVSSLMVFDESRTLDVFTNWRPSSATAIVCDVASDAKPAGGACVWQSLNPGAVAVMTLTGQAPELPTWEQCGPVENTAWFFFFDAETPVFETFQADLSPVQTAIFSNTVITRLNCQPGVEITKMGVVDTGDNERVDAGDIVTYSIEVTNSGNMALYDIAVTDDMPGLTWQSGSTIDELAPGASGTLIATYAVTQQDIDNGEVVNTAEVDASTVVEEEPPVEITILQDAPDNTTPITVSAIVTEVTELEREPDVSLAKTSATGTGDDGELNLGDAVEYTFTITNTGNVTLTDLEILDEMEGVTFDDGMSIDELAPGDEAELTASYIVTQADVDAGIIVNCADITAVAPDESVVSDDDCATDLVGQNPAMEITYTCQGPTDTFLPEVGDEVTIELTITNNGDQTVHEIAVEISREGELDTGFPTTLAPGESAIREWTGIVTQEDYDAREVVVEVAASGQTEAGFEATLASAVALQANTSVIATVTITCPMAASPVEPTPTPAPATPGPTTPEVKTPPVVSKLPSTGSGGSMVFNPLFGLAATIAMVALGVGATGVRRLKSWVDSRTRHTGGRRPIGRRPPM